MDGMRGYDDWKTTEPRDPYQEDYCPECGLGLAQCKCEEPEEAHG